jgi:hypothetical protein
MAPAIANAKTDGNIAMQKTDALQNVQHPEHLPITVVHAFVQKLFAIQTADLMQTATAKLPRFATLRRVRFSEMIANVYVLMVSCLKPPEMGVSVYLRSPVPRKARKARSSRAVAVAAAVAAAGVVDRRRVRGLGRVIVHPIVRWDPTDTAIATPGIPQIHQMMVVSRQPAPTVLAVAVHQAVADQAAQAVADQVAQAALAVLQIRVPSALQENVARSQFSEPLVSLAVLVPRAEVLVPQV